MTGKEYYDQTMRLLDEHPPEQPVYIIRTGRHATLAFQSIGRVSREFGVKPLIIKQQHQPISCSGQHNKIKMANLNKVRKAKRRMSNESKRKNRK